MGTTKFTTNTSSKLVVALVSDIRNQLGFSFLYLFYLMNVSLALNAGTRIALHSLDVGGLGICIMGRSVLCFCTWNFRKWTPVLGWPFCSFTLFVFATWGLWWWWFLVPAVDLLSATVDCTCYSCFAYCCVQCASQNIYIHWNVFATSTRLLISSCSSIMSSGFLARFGIICKFCHFADNISI